MGGKKLRRAILVGDFERIVVMDVLDTYGDVYQLGLLCLAGVSCGRFVGIVMWELFA